MNAVSVTPVVNDEAINDFADHMILMRCFQPNCSAGVALFSSADSIAHIESRTSFSSLKLHLAKNSLSSVGCNVQYSDNAFSIKSDSFGVKFTEELQNQYKIKGIWEKAKDATEMTNIHKEMQARTKSEDESVETKVMKNQAGNKQQHHWERIRWHQWNRLAFLSLEVSFDMFDTMMGFRNTFNYGLRERSHLWSKGTHVSFRLRTLSSVCLGGAHANRKQLSILLARSGIGQNKPKHSFHKWEFPGGVVGQVAKFSFKHPTRHDTTTRRATRRPRLKVTLASVVFWTNPPNCFKF